MKFSVITLGCTLNREESNRMIGILSKKYEYTENIEQADILIINTCTVKTPSENEAIKLVEKYKDKKIILAGCLVQHRPELFEKYNYPMVGVYNIDKIDYVLDKYLNEGKIEKILEKRKLNTLNLPSYDRYPIKIVPIQVGCLWNCLYCATKKARSLTYSFSPDEIYREVRDAKLKNLKIIYFTGTDLAAYGYDLNIDLADLLFGLREIKGEYYVRVGMANPGILNKFFDKLLDAYEYENIFKFFHLPVQSGSNKVLETMGRGYKIEDFYELVEKLRKRYYEGVLATDIIVGYPTETEEDFRETLNLVESTKPDVINISRYWPRFGTLSYKLYKPLRGTIVKNRSRKLREIFNKVAYERNKEWIGWEGYCIVESRGKGGSWICRNYAYKQIIVKENKNILGKILKVKVESATPIDLRAKILDIKEEVLEENKLY